jgi:hypothetical protein
VLIAGAGTAAAVVIPDLVRGKAAVTQPAAMASPIAPSPPPPQHPTTATLTFESNPPHARVFRQGESVPLGTTPFSKQLARSTEPTQLRFELAGHEPYRIEVVVDADRVVSGTLVPAPLPEPVVDRRKPSVGTPPVKQPPGVHREGVMDPFKN